MILAISEHPGVGLPLRFVGVGAESSPQVFSWCRFKLEWNHSTVILSMLEYLGVGLPLCVVELGVEPVLRSTTGTGSDGRDPCHWLGRDSYVSGSLGPSYSGIVVVASSFVVLGMLEYL